MSSKNTSKSQISTELKPLLEAELKRLDAIAARFPARDKQAYAWWLAQTYYFVCHSTRLLALAAARFGREHDRLHFRFSEHVLEEKGHEFLASKDLKGLGLDISEFPELPETQAFYQTQYYWIEHVHPIAFFGYILCLEAFSLRGANRIYQEALQAFGEKSTVFLKVHVQEDIGHLDQALKHVNDLPEDQKKMVAENLKLSAHLYAQIYERILAIHSGSKSALAA